MLGKTYLSPINCQTIDVEWTDKISIIYAGKLSFDDRKNHDSIRHQRERQIKHIVIDL